jgi:hypothetical protein
MNSGLKTGKMLKAAMLTPVAAELKNTVGKEENARSHLIRPGALNNRFPCDESVSPTPRDCAHEQEDQQDNEQESQDSTWAITPGITVRPGGYGPEQQQDQNDQENQPHGFSPSG